MRRFIFFLEGKTEKEGALKFIRRWFNENLRDAISVTGVDLEGFGHFRRKIHRVAPLHLNGPKSGEIIGGIGLLDLYGPNFYPKSIRSAAKRFEWGKKHFEEQVGHEKFRMFFAVHEVEAWLLTAPEHLHVRLSQQDLRRIRSPEKVNFTSPPSRFLSDRYKRHFGKVFKKTTQGLDLFDRINPHEAYAKCPYLREMLDELLRMAREAGLQ